MTYLPNSIERLTPIVGYDPYAFIMGRPSNLTVNKMSNPYDCDYFTKDVKENNAGKPKGEKFGNLKSILKGALGLATVGLAIYGGAKLIKGHCPTFGISTVTGGIKGAFKWTGNKIGQFGGFLQRKFTPTPPTP